VQASNHARSWYSSADAAGSRGDLRGACALPFANRQAALRPLTAGCHGRLVARGFVCRIVRERERHSSVVDAWLGSRAARCASATDVGALLLEALRAIWSRTQTTLGEVTLVAIFNRVLVTARQESPVLASVGLRVTVDLALEIDADALRGANRDAMLAATHALLVELLAVLGRLTGETLTPSLRATLAALDREALPEPTATRKDDGHDD